MSKDNNSWDLTVIMFLTGDLTLILPFKKEQWMMVLVRGGINVNGFEYQVGKGAWKHACEREKAMSGYFNNWEMYYLEAITRSGQCYYLFIN